MKSRGPFHPLFSVLAVLLLLVLALGFCGFFLPTQYDDSYLGEMKYKKALLQETEGPRIVVIGGSSVPFSLCSNRIEEALPDYKVVDFGLYADLGTLPMLDLVRSDLQIGDLVVIAPEQEAQALSAYAGGESLWQALDGAFFMLGDLSSRYYEILLSSYPVFAGKKLHYALTGAPELAGIYVRSSFNRWGDIESPDRSSNIMASGFQASPRIAFHSDLPSEEFITELNHFTRELTALGIQVVYHFPPMNADALEEGTTPSMIDAYYDALDEKLDMPLLGDPHRCILDSGWFYDTNFHLNTSGAQVYTQLLIEDLKVFLKDTSPTDLTLPSMPPKNIGSSEGDDSCAAFFTYEEAEKGRIITGYTDEGLRQARLILPTHVNEQPVIGIHPQSLQNHPRLEELTIQPNISMLWDGMLEGCFSLKEVYLTEKSPSAYSVGDHWMQGVSFRICVPAEALDAYRRSYFWQKYESWLSPADP